MGRLYVNVFTADPKCQYFICNMCKCVRGTLGGRGSTSGKVRGRFGDGSGMVRGRSGEGPGKVRKASGGATQGQAPDPPVGILYGTLIILLL